jgi:hypothetical protein
MQIPIGQRQNRIAYQRALRQRSHFVEAVEHDQRFTGFQRFVYCSLTC